MFLVSYVRQGTYMKKVALLFLVKGHTKNNAYRKFNFLKQKQDGKDIWTVVELNVAPTKWNKEFIDLLQLINEHVKAWTKASTIIIKTLWSALFSATRFFFCSATAIFASISNNRSTVMWLLRSSISLQPTSQAECVLISQSRTKRRTPRTCRIV